MSRWYVYVLRCRDKSLYTGISTDVLARLEKHNAGKGAAYTRSRMPVTLVWSKACKTESAARKREAEIKRWKKAEKEAFISGTFVV
ncbi:MAG: GIY-YIG nuclease family protein [Patescibacteria group bacterium]|mgnify:CR=1 FL=1